MSPICGRIVIHLICCKCCPSLEIWTGDDVAAVTSEDEEDDCISAPSCPGIQLHHRLPQEVGGEDVVGDAEIIWASFNEFEIGGNEFLLRFAEWDQAMPKWRTSPEKTKNR